jgi:hypothetical protein
VPVNPHSTTDHMLRLAVAGLLFAAVLVFGPAGTAAAADAPPKARAAGEDSPWPRTNALRPNVRAARKEINRLTRRVQLLELSVARYDDWETCLTYVPVSEYGDPWENRFGYLYDAREGTGAGFMDALAIDRKSRPRKEDYMFIDFARDGCRSDSPKPGGTAEPASVQPPPVRQDGLRPLEFPLRPRNTARTPTRDAPRASASRSKRRGSLKRQVRRLTRRAERLFQRAQVLEAASERFDEWESCVSWVPVTEQGGADFKFGYLYGAVGAWPGYRPAIHIDRSDWDDPDYMFLALVGGDRPGRTCQDEPGEAVD